ncbi:GAF domain-containing sensor histidine kinase [Shouchella lehensis]|uniref:Oxygen sensor histidine kinase NreB n=2 Tax=Shouchella lehensis TaxID=300825 RepID=A0A4Y7WF94_9BACI|nr:GAF domain-containing sensor histidine kinase [Shouchella lehensis]
MKDTPLQELQMNSIETLKEIAKTLNEGERIEDILQAVLVSLLETTGLKTGWIFLVSPQGKQRLVAQVGLPQGLRHQTCAPLKEGSCYCVNKYNNGELHEPINIMNCKRLKLAVENDWGDTGGLSRHATIPIKAGSESFGLINIASPSIDTFSRNELELFETVAYQIGATIKRLNAYIEEQKQTALLSQLGKYLAFQRDVANEDDYLATVGETLQTFFGWKGVRFFYNEWSTFTGEEGDASKTVRLPFDQHLLELCVYDEGLSAGVESVLYEVLTHISLQLKQFELNRQQQQLWRREERNRLARDLHDSVNQLLFSLILHAKGLERQLEDGDMKATVAHVHELGNQALVELKELIKQLRPEGLESGLAAKVEAYARLIGLAVVVEVEGLKKIAEPLEVCVWRLIQEGLNNCQKHAKTKDVTVRLLFGSEAVTVQIVDQGIGFDPDTVRKGMGFVNIKERVQEMGGTVTIVSARHQGTTVNISIPLVQGDNV